MEQSKFLSPDMKLSVCCLRINNEEPQWNNMYTAAPRVTKNQSTTGSGSLSDIDHCGQNF